MPAMDKLKDIEERAARLTSGDYWTETYVDVAIVCYCIMGLLGTLFIPAVIHAQWAWKLPIGIAAIAWYATWMGIVPIAWRTRAAREIIDRHDEKTRNRIPERKSPPPPAIKVSATGWTGRP